MSDTPDDYGQRMVAGIVAFTLTITRLEGKWTISQKPENRAGIVAGLQREGAEKVAAIVAAYNKKDAERP